jgi:hypothetical protein
MDTILYLFSCIFQSHLWSIRNNRNNLVNTLWMLRKCMFWRFLIPVPDPNPDGTMKSLVSTVLFWLLCNNPNVPTSSWLFLPTGGHRYPHLSPLTHITIGLHSSGLDFPRRNKDFLFSNSLIALVSVLIIFQTGVLWREVSYIMSLWPLRPIFWTWLYVTLSVTRK